MEEEKYLPELMAEKDSLDSSFVHAMRLLAEEIEKFQSSDEKKEDEEKKYLDVISNKNIKLSERVLIPVKQYPKLRSHSSRVFSRRFLATLHFEPGAPGIKVLCGWVLKVTKENGLLSLSIFFLFNVNLLLSI
uniref:KH RNA binding domain containing, signal transduction associated 2 n=1 Tax=Anolis carolinensis TaxID=28377 RepID=A0A803SM69_ANOCA